MPGIIRQCAHVGGANIQHMLGIAGVIREAAADFVPSLDQRHPKPEFPILQELIGEQYTASAAADNDRVPCCETAHETASRLQ
jgi:hypothetical protein